MNFLDDKDGFTVRDFIAVALTVAFLFMVTVLTWTGHGLTIFDRVMYVFILVVGFYFYKGGDLLGSFRKIFAKR